MARLLFRLGSGAHRHRVAVVLVWLVALVGAGVGALTLSGETSTTFSIPGQESTTAQTLIGERFGGAGAGATARVVVQAPAGQTVTAGPAAAEVGELVTALGGLPGVVSATNPLDPAAPAVDPGQTTGYSTVTYAAGMGAVSVAEQDALRAAAEQARAGGLTVEIGGDALNEGAPPIGGPAEIIGVVLALVILTLTFGTLVAAGMNLLTAVVGVGIGVLGITIATGFLELNSTTSALAGMLGLAVGIDYALFIITRFRQELLRGRDVPAAVATAVGTAGSAVVTAGLTVVIALVGLVVAGIPFLSQMGIAAAATILVAVLVAVTLVPAVLGLVGTRMLSRKQRAVAAQAHDAGRHERPEPVQDSPRFYGRWIDTTTRRRVPTLVLGIAALAVIAIPVLSMQTTLVVAPPDDSTQARAEQLLAGSFGEGFNGPLTVLVDGPGAAEAAAAVTPGLTALGDVAAVTPPIPNADGSAALLTVVPRSGPTSAATEALVGEMRGVLDGVGGGAQAYVTGATAVSVDVSDSLDQALPIYLVLVVGLAFLLLVLVFRSVLVPLVGVLGFLLTIAASLGATTAVFQWGWLSELIALDTTGPLIALAPILIIGILFGLAMDYQVFLVSRIHEAHGRGASALDAVGAGFRQAAPVVVAAAAIMTAVFAGFVPEGDATLKSIAFALAVGVVVDAFVVRLVLMPAALALLGERAWWLPSWLRWLPVLDVEGTALQGGAPAGREPETART